MVFFNCCVWMQVYFIEGFWLLKDIVSCNNGSPVTTPISVTEHSNSGFEPRVFYLCTFCKASTTIGTLLTGFCTLKYKVKCGDIYLFSFLFRLYDVQDHWIIVHKNLDSLWLPCKLESRFVPHASDLSKKSQP